MKTEVEELAGQLTERRAKLNEYFEKKTADGRFDWTAAQRDEVLALNKEVDALHGKWEGAREIAVIEQKNREAIEALNKVVVPGVHASGAGTGNSRIYQGRIGNDGAALMEKKGIGHQFVEHKAYRETFGARQGRNNVGFSLPDFEVKTLFQTSAGFDPFVPRQPFIVTSAQQQPRVVDLLPTSRTDFHSIKWMLETTYTNAADATAEGGAFPEAALVFTEQLSPVQKISVFIPTTDEQLEDVARMQDLLNNRLTLMLRQKLDSELVAGTGTSPHLKGLLSLSGRQTQAKGTDPAPSAIYKAMTKIRNVAFSEPTGVLFNPTDWQNIRLLQTADGLYIWGHPSADGPDRIWGLPVVQTTYETLGHAAVADFQMHTELIWRKGIEFLVSNSHSDYFTSGKQAIRADLRAAFICTREAAVCEVTGL